MSSVKVASILLHAVAIAATGALLSASIRRVLERGGKYQYQLAAVSAVATVMESFGVALVNQPFAPFSAHLDFAASILVVIAGYLMLLSTLR